MYPYNIFAMYFKRMELIISPSNKCNMFCKMCDIGNRSPDSSGLYNNLYNNDEIAVTDWFKIFDYVKPTKINIIGVEPLLYNGIDYLIDRIKRDLNVPIVLTTNGFYIADHIGYLNKCVHVTVSVDGLESTHDKIRGVQGAHAKAINGMALLRGIKTAVRVSYAITPDNVKDIVPIYKFATANSMGVVFNHFNFIHPESCIGENCTPSNLAHYDPSNVDLELLHESIKTCRLAAFLPKLNTYLELQRYYRIIPAYRKIGSTCVVIAEQLAGKRRVVNPNGDFIIGNRCWINKKLGNGLDYTYDHKIIKDISVDIAKNGLPAPCQRLCCAGKTV